jgi:hypothetical protein
MKLFLRMTQTGPEAYSLTQLRQDNPSVSFPDQINAEVLADFGVYEYAQQDRPQTIGDKQGDHAQTDRLRRLQPACGDVGSKFDAHHTRAAPPWGNRSHPLADRAPTRGRSCWLGGQEADLSTAGYCRDYARQKSRHVP